MRICLAFLLALPVFADARIEVQGHRGARWVRPENSIPAFLYALESGVDTLEMDLHVTKDDVLVVTHDPYLSRDLCLGKNGKPPPEHTLIRSLTLEQLRVYDCGSRANRRFPEQVKVPHTPIATLDEVLTAVRNSKLSKAQTVSFNIETKSDPAHPEFTPEPRAFVNLFLATIKKRRMLERVTLQSFDYRTLDIAHELEPRLSLSVLVENKPKVAEELAELLTRHHARILSPNHEWLTAEMVNAVHRASGRVIAWTPNRRADWERLLAIGVDGLITDNPKVLLEFLAHP